MKSLVGVIVLFLVTRAAMLATPSVGSDVPIYAGYAVGFETARRLGVSFYDFQALPYAEKQRLATAVSRHIPPHDVPVFEYPPLALLPMLAPRMIWTAFCGPGGDCTLAEYTAAYRAEMFLVDVLLFAGLAWLLRGLYPVESWNQTAVRLAAYVLGGALLPHLIYARFDLPFAALLTAALGLLVLGRRATALIALALSVALKMASLPLIPFWAVGSLRGHSPPDHGKNLLALAGYLAIALAACGICFAPAAWSGGRKCVDFLTYHQQRGIQIESTYASILFAARLLGNPLEVDSSYGSANVVTPQSATLARLSGPLAMLCAVILAAVFYVRAVRRPPVASASTLGAAHKGLAVQMVFAGLLALMLSSKVLSPQYLLWLLPLVCLLPGDQRRRWWIYAVFLGACALSSLTYPYLFARIVRGFSPNGAPSALAWVGVAVAAIRNVGLATLLALVWRTPVHESQ